MKAKKLITAVAITAALTIPVSVFAATSDTTVAKRVRGFLGIDTTKLTDTQKADVTSYKQKLADLQKEFINKMVANGSITKEQGDAEIAQIDEALKNGNSTVIPGFSGGKGDFDGRGMNGRGGFGLYGIDLTKLTDAQKADLTAEVKNMATLRKDLVNKVVAAGLLTKTNGDAEIAEIDAALADLDKNGFTNGFSGLMGGKAFGMMRGMGDTTLTDAQKALFTDFNTSMTALEKELVNKMVSNGALTQEQGTAATNRINEMSKMEANGPQMGGEMGKGGFGGGHRGMKGGRFHDEGAPFGTNPGTTTGNAAGQST